jgi:predicted HTH transcriptional regulator
MNHRNYFSEGRILIEIFSDRIEISNPVDFFLIKMNLVKQAYLEIH